MITANHIRYLIDDVCSVGSCDYECVVSERCITVTTNAGSYQEPVFSFTKPSLGPHDHQLLDYLQQYACRAIGNNRYDVAELSFMCDRRECNSLKIIHFFANEHYLVDTPTCDEHGRVTSQNIDARYRKYLEYPLASIIIAHFRTRLFPCALARKTLYLTSDFDFMHMWRYLGVQRSLYRFVKALVKGRLSQFFYELKSLLYSDKYLDCNPLLSLEIFSHPQVHGLDIKSIVFVHDSRLSEFDHRNDHRSSSFAEFLNRHGAHLELGLHPSYSVREKPETFGTERGSFVQVFGFYPVYSRFHYLRFVYPDDLTMLENNGITHDFSFSFPDAVLFRGGISSPYKMWMTMGQRPSTVTLVPLTMMDVTLIDKRALGYDEALSVAWDKIAASLLFGTSCNLLFHNNMMYEDFKNDNYIPALKRELMNRIEKLHLPNN